MAEGSFRPQLQFRQGGIDFGEERLSLEVLGDRPRFLEMLARPLFLLAHLVEKPEVGVDPRQEVAVAAEHDILSGFDKQFNRLIPTAEGGDDKEWHVLEEDAEWRHLLGR